MIEFIQAYQVYIILSGYAIIGICIRVLDHKERQEKKINLYREER